MSRLHPPTKCKPHAMCHFREESLDKHPQRIVYYYIRFQISLFEIGFTYLYLYIPTFNILVLSWALPHIAQIIVIIQFFTIPYAVEVHFCGFNKMNSSFIFEWPPPPLRVQCQVESWPISAALYESQTNKYLKVKEWVANVFISIKKPLGHSHYGGHANVGETGDNCNTGHVVTGDPTPRENDLRWLF